MPDSYDTFLGRDEDPLEMDSIIFKRHFLTDDGQYCLAKILHLCKFMESCENERDMERNNLAKELLWLIYYDRDKKMTNIHRIMEYVREKLCRK